MPDRRALLLLAVAGRETAALAVALFQNMAQSAGRIGRCERHDVQAVVRLVESGAGGLRHIGVAVETDLAGQTADRACEPPWPRSASRPWSRSNCVGGTV